MLGLPMVAGVAGSSLCCSVLLLMKYLQVGAEGGVETGGAPESGVLHHKVVYKPLPAPPKYKRWTLLATKKIR